MARIKYYYDTETCKYERIKVSKWDILLNMLGFLTVSLLLAVGLVFVFYKYFESPKEMLLRKENEELQFHYEVIDKEITDVKEMLKKRDEACPTKKMGNAWDVAHAALFLASDEARYITGANLVVDGGLTCK